MDKRGLLLVGLLALTACYGLLAIPPTDALVPWKSIAADKKLCVTPATQGWLNFGTTAYFGSYSRASTGGINDFFQFRVGPSGDVWDRVGFCVDNPAVNMTVTSVEGFAIHYTLVGGLGTQRIWCPDAGEPISVQGGVLSWDALNTVATITPTAATVVLRWTPTTPELDDLNSKLILYYAIMGLIPILGAAALVMAAYNGALELRLVGVVVSSVIAVMLGLLLVGAMIF